MKVALFIPDYLLPRMQLNKKRVEGTLGLLNEGELDFNPYNRKPRRKGDALLRLPHGRAVLRGKEASLRLHFDTAAETVCVPVDLMIESDQASDFFATVIPATKTGQRPPRSTDLEMEPAY